MSERNWKSIEGSGMTLDAEGNLELKGVDPTAAYIPKMILDNSSLRLVSTDCTLDDVAKGIKDIEEALYELRGEIMDVNNSLIRLGDIIEGCFINIAG